MNREPLSIERIKFENPGVYRIVVQGSLDENWSDRLAGMQITTSAAKACARPATRSRSPARSVAGCGWARFSFTSRARWKDGLAKSNGPDS